MMLRSFFLAIILFCTLKLLAQGGNGIDTSNVFARLAKEMADFKVDTLDPPDDKITRKIIELRSLRGGFNINEAIEFKIEEDRQNKKMSENEINDLLAFFRSGQGKKQLDNAVIWIYREHFSYNEIKDLVRFYKTPAGQKLANHFPVIMLKSLAAAEMIKSQLAGGKKL